MALTWMVLLVLVRAAVIVGLTSHTSTIQLTVVDDDIVSGNN